LTVDLKNRLNFFYPFLIVWLLLLPFIFFPKGETSLAINGANSVFFDLFFKNFTKLGEGVFIVFLVLLLLFMRLKWGITFILALTFHLIFITVNKNFIFKDIYRPLGYFNELGLNNVLHVVEGVKLHSKHSFPSGHTTGALFGASFILLLFTNKKLAWIMAIIGLLVGYSRVYLGQHFLLDIFFGYFFGVSSTVLAYILIYKIHSRYSWMNRIIIRSEIKFLKELNRRTLEF
jgi:membrane-associated phospholipid phosphatase